MTVEVEEKIRRTGRWKEGYVVIPVYLQSFLGA